MKQTKAPELTPSPSSKVQTRAVAGKDSASTIFISMAVDMTWRLIVVVLVPVIVGALLDSRFKVRYVYVLSGLGLGLILGGLVVYKSYQTANVLTAGIKKGKKS